MGLHTDYLGSIRIDPLLNADEVAFLRSVNATRHCGDVADPLDVAEHPQADGPPADVRAANTVRPGRPGLWCPWTACLQGCCLRWDGAEKPYQPERWLTYLIDTYLRPGAALAGDLRAAALGLTFDHVLDGMLVGERAETTELFALEVRSNVVRRKVLLAGQPGVNEWGYPDEAGERRLRRERLLARRRRFALAVEEELRRTG